MACIIATSGKRPDLASPGRTAATDPRLPTRSFLRHSVRRRHPPFLGGGADSLRLPTVPASDPLPPISWRGALVTRAWVVVKRVGCGFGEGQARGARRRIHGASQGLPAAAGGRAEVPRALDDLDPGHGPHEPGLGRVGPPSFKTPLAAYEEARRESRDRHGAVVVLVRRGHDAIATRHAPASFEAPEFAEKRCEVRQAC